MDNKCENTLKLVIISWLFSREVRRQKELHSGAKKLHHFIFAITLLIFFSFV